MQAARLFDLYNGALFISFFFQGDCGKSSRPARVLLVGTHADLVPSTTTKNAVGETSSRGADAVLGEMLDRFGNVFNVHPRVFAMDANVSNSQDMRALKQTIIDIKAEIVDVRTSQLKKSK